MQIGGLPLHPLVVHAVVVLVPLSALLVVGFAVLPSWRWLTRWPTAAAALLVPGLLYAATRTGRQLLAERPFLLSAPDLAARLATHQERGELLLRVSFPFAALVLLGVWALGGPSALASGRGAREARLRVLDRALPPVLVVASAGVLVLTVLAGHSGASAVWSLTSSALADLA